MTWLVHATEDGEKIGGAVARLFGASAPPRVERLEGHFGNEILKARVHLTGEEAARATRSLFSALPGAVKAAIVADLDRFVDEHSALFLRLDKQALVTGSLALGSGDPVRVKVKPRLFIVKGSAPQFYSGLMGGEANG